LLQDLQASLQQRRLQIAMMIGISGLGAIQGRLLQHDVNNVRISFQNQGKPYHYGRFLNFRVMRRAVDRTSATAGRRRSSP
jgi:hypothetical protein